MILASINPFEHVLDTEHWHFFESIHLGFKLPLGLTKFIVLQLIAAGLICAIYIPLARKIKNGEPAKGWFWNSFEVLLTYIRDEVAKPCIGHGADKYTPFLWTFFLYILFCNLLGMIPFFGSPTGSLFVTGALALCAFALIHGAAIIKHGPWHYVVSHVPHIEAPFKSGILIGLFIAAIEIMGHFIKGFVLAVRLFANIFAGHTVLAVILMLIVMAKDTSGFLFWPISVGSVFAVVALSFLELFVAFLQAFVFTFLSALFLGSTLHPEH